MPDLDRPTDPDLLRRDPAPPLPPEVLFALDELRRQRGAVRALTERVDRLESEPRQVPPAPALPTELRPSQLRRNATRAGWGVLVAILAALSQVDWATVLQPR